MNLPILDTEEKLREYLNKVAGCEVDPLTIKAHIFPDRVHLDTNRDTGIHIALAQSSPRWFQVQSFGIVDRAVLPVLKELHARHDREIQEAIQKRLEESCEREVKKAARRAQCLEKEIAYHQSELEKKQPSLLTRILNLLK
jgi:hypothetical protein